MAIHSIDKDGKITPYKKMPVSKEAEIEDFIEKNPEILEKDLIIIARQKETSDGKIVDLMGLDKSGNVVIIELKKDNVARKVISQILDYAVWAEDLKYEELNSIFKDGPSTEYSTLNEKFQDWTNEIETEFNQNQKLYVIGEEIDPRTEKLARYLRQKGIDIYCIEINFHELDGHRVVDKREIVVEDNAPVRKSQAPRTEEDHLAKGESGISELYSLLKTKVLEFGNDITVNPVQNYIGFVRHGKNFLWVKIRKEFMTLGLQVQDSFDDPKNMASQYRKDKENLKRVVFKEKDELEDIMYLVKQAYDTI